MKMIRFSIYFEEQAYMDNTEYQKLIQVFSAFFEEGKIIQISPIGAGLIHRTYKLTIENSVEPSSFVLQQINYKIFPNPKAIMENIALVNAHLSESNYPDTVLEAIMTKSQTWLHRDETGQFWRLFPYIKNSTSYNQVETIAQATEAARTFGRYFNYLNNFDPLQLKETIPDFHNTPLRYQLLQKAIEQDKMKRRSTCFDLIREIQEQAFLTQELMQLDLPIRLTHNDTKINNVLFDQNTQKGIAIIDLDTLMPGTLLTDFGDMVRTFTPNFSEESQKIEAIQLRQDIFEGLCDGFLSVLKGVLLPIEKANLLIGAKVIIFEQVLRFLTDYLQGDTYYSTHYENQNLYRARNQWQLLRSLIGQETELNAILEKYG